MNNMIATKKVECQNAILTRCVEDLKKYIFQMDNIADEINIGDDTDKIKNKVKNNVTYGKYVIHNAGSSKKYNSLSEAINGYNNGNGEPISVIGIKKKGGK